MPKAVVGQVGFVRSVHANVGDILYVRNHPYSQRIENGFVWGGICV